MSLDYLQGSFTPKSARYFENNDYFLYQGETFQGRLSVLNYDKESYGAFNVDLYISNDGIIDESDYYLGTHNVADGIPGKEFVAPRHYRFDVSAVTLPSKDSDFWTDKETYYLGAIINPNSAILESELENNPDLEFFREENTNPITIQVTDLPVVNFTQEDSTLNINLSETAPEDGLTINYHNKTKEDYINELGNSYEDEDYYTPQYYGDRAYDSELNRLYITGGNYHDLTNYQYYDVDGGHYNPYQDKYYNANNSYYDVGEKLFYDADGNATELVDNSIEYEDESSSPKHYLPTGGYISLISGVFYDGSGGYIDEITEKYFFQEGDNGFGSAGYDIKDLKEVRSFEITGTGTLPKIATPDLDYEIVPGENIENITDTTITIAPGETSATVDFNFLSDSIFDPDEVIEFELLEDSQQNYIASYFPLYRFQVIDPSNTIGDDSVVGSANHDIINEIAGSDSIDGGTANDLVLDSGGSDLLNGSSVHNPLNNSIDDDLVLGSLGDDFLL